MAGLIVLLMQGSCGHRMPYYGSAVRESPPGIAPDDQQIRYRVLLIGDAGAARRATAEPVLQTLRQWAAVVPQKTTVVFLGDNMYPRGMPLATAGDARQEAEGRLCAQLNVLQASRARGLFIPGNHDWAAGGEDGYDALQRQASFIQRLSRGEGGCPGTLPSGPFEARLLPRDGCPGPCKMDVEGVRLIALDTHWWLHAHHKPTSACVDETPLTERQAASVHMVKDRVVKQLQQAVQTADDRLVLIVGHHPMATHGRHGGFFTWKDHVFPFTHLAEWLWIPTPLVGSIYPLLWWHWTRSNQDLAGPDNQEMVRRLRYALNQSPSTSKLVLYAAGHEHNLQVLKGGTAIDYLLVSGAGSATKISPVSHGADTLFAHSHAGFMAVDSLIDGRVLLRVIEPGDRQVAFFKWLETNR